MLVAASATPGKIPARGVDPVGGRGNDLLQPASEVPLFDRPDFGLYNVAVHRKGHEGRDAALPVPPGYPGHTAAPEGHPLNFCLKNIPASQSIEPFAKFPLKEKGIYHFSANP
jgi:hypothetical protein